MSRTDFEKMMSDEQTVYKSPAEEEDSGVEIVFEEDGSTQTKEVKLDNSIDNNVNEKKQPAERTKNRIDRLTFEREEAKRLASAKAAEAEGLRRQNQQLLEERSAFTNTNMQMADTMRESMRSSREKELATAKANLKKAFDDGDGDALAEAQSEVARVQTELSHIHLAEENAKQFKTQNKKQAAQPTQTQRPAPQAYTNPQQTMSAETTKWVDQNKHWFGQPGYEGETSYAYGLHERLVRQGHVAGSESYWEEANKTLQKTFPHLDNGENFGAKNEMNGSQDDNINTASRPNVAAPSSRTAKKDPRSNKVVLTASQVAIARKLGLQPEQYAAQLLKKNYDGVN